MKPLPEMDKRADKRARPGAIQPEPEPPADAEQPTPEPEFETNLRARAWRSARLRRPD
jgi:hypothetical protein